MERTEGLAEEFALGQQTCDGDGDGPAEAGEHGVQTDDHDCMRFTRGLRPTVVAAAPRAHPPPDHRSPPLATQPASPYYFTPPFSNEQGLLNSLPKLRPITQQELQMVGVAHFFLFLHIGSRTI